MKKDVRVLMVTVYLFLMAAFLYLQPDIAFGREGRIRPFGTQEKEATIFPVWWWVFVIAVVSYMLTFFITRSRMFQ
jgi:quinol-cytochrome oxidoreductase complex cytochrome b subunit